MSISETNIASSFKSKLESMGVALGPDSLTIFTAMAESIVDEITNNAVIKVTVDATSVGLQTSTAAGTPTAGPAAPVVITGVIE